MADIAVLQTVDAGIDAVENATNRTVQFTSNIAAGSVLIVCTATRENNPDNFIVSDDKGNDWLKIKTDYVAGSGRGAGAYYAVANGASIGAKPIVTFDKVGANCGVAGSIFELANVHADILDGAAVSANLANTGPAEVVLSTPPAYTDNLIFAVLGSSQSSYVVATPKTNYVDVIATTSDGVSFQHKVQTRAVTTRETFTPGWTLDALTDWAVVAFAVKGNTTLPAIESLSAAQPLAGGLLTVTGLLFGVSQGFGTVTVGGVTASVNSWSATNIEVVVQRGANPFGVELDVQVNTNSLGPSNLFPVSSILPQSGWDYVVIDGLEEDAAKRLTAFAELADGDQVAWDTRVDLGANKVVVFRDATFIVAPTVNLFRVEAWTSGSGWGRTSLQTFDGSTPFSPILPVLPTGIPYPQAVEIKPKERRTRSSLSGAPERDRARTNDFLGSLSITWPPFTQVQMVAFFAWGRIDLNEWSSWFSMALPGRSIDVPFRAVRFIEPPAWTYIGPGAGRGWFRVTATVEQRGRSVV